MQPLVNRRASSRIPSLRGASTCPRRSRPTATPMASATRPRTPTRRPGSPTPDTASPDTTITKQPEGQDQEEDRDVRVHGHRRRAIASFQCSLDGGAVHGLHLAHTVKVKKGKHTFAGPGDRPGGQRRRARQRHLEAEEEEVTAVARRRSPPRSTPGKGITRDGLAPTARRARCVAESEVSGPSRDTARAMSQENV